jgi:hypothetical protein
MFALVVMALPAGSAPTADGSRDALVAAQAMAADAGTVVNAMLESDATGTTSELALMEFVEDSYNGFPSGDDESFMALATGDAALMNDGGQDVFVSSGLGGMLTNRGTDLAGLTTEFSIPAGNGQPCFIVDLKFLSEEFPEYVGSSFNDFVVGRINNTAPPTISDELTPVAEGNFLRDGDGNAITVNNNYDVTAARANDTVYDGATPTLQARSTVPDAGSFTFSVWIADVGDNIYDSMVFLDNARVIRTDDCQSGTFGPSDTTVKAKVKSGKVRVNGTVIPPAPGVEMIVTLLKKQNGKFQKVGTSNPALGDGVELGTGGLGSKYKTSFNDPSGSGTCKVKARFPGDNDTFPSTAQKTFDC